MYLSIYLYLSVYLSIWVLRKTSTQTNKIYLESIQQHFFMEIDHKIEQSFSPFHFKKDSCQFLVKECAQGLVTAYRTAQEKCG